MLTLEARVELQRSSRVILVRLLRRYVVDVDSGDLIVAHLTHPGHVDLFLELSPQCRVCLDTALKLYLERADLIE